MFANIGPVIRFGCFYRKAVKFATIGFEGFLQGKIGGLFSLFYFWGIGRQTLEDACLSVFEKKAEGRSEKGGKGHEGAGGKNPEGR